MNKPITATVVEQKNKYNYDKIVRAPFQFNLYFAGEFPPNETRDKFFLDLAQLSDNLGFELDDFREEMAVSMMGMDISVKERKDEKFRDLYSSNEWYIAFRRGKIFSDKLRYVKYLILLYRYLMKHTDKVKKFVINFYVNDMAITTFPFDLKTKSFKITNARLSSIEEKEDANKVVGFVKYLNEFLKENKDKVPVK